MAGAVAKPLALKGAFSKYKQVGGLVLALVIGLFFWVVCPIDTLGVDGNRVLGTLIAWIILLLCEIADAAIVTLLWITFLVVTGLTKGSVAFEGFTSTTTWLLIGAMMIGVAATKTGLAKRIAYLILSFSGEKYKSLTIWLMVSGAILGIIMPSGTARMAVYIPIYLGLCEVMKIEKNSKTAVNLAMFMIWSASIGAGSMMWLTGSVLNPIMTSALEQFDVFISWGRYALFAVPSALLMCVGVYFAIHFICPAEKYVAGGKDVIKNELEALGPMTRDETKALILFLICVLAWIGNDFLNDLLGLKLHNAWSAMLVGGFLFFPKIGVLEGKDIKSVSWSAVLFIGASLAISDIMTNVGVDTWISDSLLSPFMEPFAQFGYVGVLVGLYIICNILHILIPSGTGTVALAVPILVSWGIAHGIGPELMGHLTLHGMRPFFFPFEHTPAILVFGYGFMKMGSFVKVASFTTLVLLIWYVISGFMWSFMV